MLNLKKTILVTGLLIAPVLVLGDSARSDKAQDLAAQARAGQGLGTMSDAVADDCSLPQNIDPASGEGRQLLRQCKDWSANPAAAASGARPRMTLQQWQLQLIDHPDREMLAREAKGFVFIYDGLRDAEVDAVLDRHFERIDAMMFTRIKLTDPHGEVLKDPATGEDLTLDDGCD